MKKLKVLFICGDNSIRSQAAAGFLNVYFADRYEACSCGLKSRALDPNAAKVMKEVGIDTSSCRPKMLEDLSQDEFDCIVTLCDYAKDNLPALPKHTKELHKGFKDFCRPLFCENAGKSSKCFPGKENDKQNMRYDVNKLEKDTLTGLRYLREAISSWVENEMVF